MKKQYILSVFLLIFYAHLTAAEPLSVWDYKDMKCIRFSSATPGAASIKTDSEIKAPNGSSLVEIQLTEGAQSKNAWDIQLNFLYNGTLKAGRNYEISFMCMADKPGQIQIIPAQTQKPYASVDKFAFKKVSVEGKWTHVKLLLTPDKDWAAENLAMPRMMFANYGCAAKIYIGSVTLRETPAVVPYNLSNKWKVFLNVKDPGTFSSVPEELSADRDAAAANGSKVTPIDVSMPPSGIDLYAYDKRYVAKRRAMLYNTFNSPGAGVMYIGIAADWWMDFYVNGNSVYSTMKNGNGSTDYAPDNHIVEIPLKAGKNILAVKVSSGSNGWRFVCGKPTKDINDLSLVTISAGKDWIPVDEQRFVVKPGTALDLSAFLEERKPAGEFGKVIMNSSGKFVFQNNPEKALRFWGFNTGFLWKINRYSKEQLKEFAVNMAMQGYNAVRLQSIDMALCGGSSPKITNKNFDDALQNDDVIFDEDALDKFDYLLSCLKANGIYYNIDLMNRHGFVPRKPWADASSQWKGGFTIQLLCNPVHRKHWEKAIRKILSHTNPYTGICIKDDPALFCVEPLNEQDIRFSEAGLEELTPSFKDYLRGRYHTESSLQKIWGPGATFEAVPSINEVLLRRGDACSKDAGDFLIAIMSDTTKWYSEVLRDAGYSGLISQWDMIMRTMEMPVRALMPVIAQHTYFEHPSKTPTKNLVIKSPMNRLCYGNESGQLKYDTLCPQSSALNSTYFRAAAIIRFIDRPFMITEYSHGFFSRYRHERGLFFGAYAALQGWDAIFCHGEMVMPDLLVKYPLVYFENARDPIARASEMVIASSWYRGDIKEAGHCIELKLSNDNLFPKHYLSAIGDDYAMLSMLTKVGISYQEVKPLLPVGSVASDIALSPEEFSNLDVRTWFATASNTGGTLLRSLIEKLKEKSILPASNTSDSAKGVFQSDTAQITIDTKSETMIVSSPCLEGAIIKEDHPVTLDNLQISSCSKPASVALMSIDKSHKIPSAKRLLLIISTNALNEGMIFSDAKMNRMVEIGQNRILLETTKLSATIRTDKTTVNVYPLYLDGTRMSEIPAQIKNGIIELNVDTSSLESGAVFFEILLQ